MPPNTLRKNTISKVWIAPLKCRATAAMQAHDAIDPIIHSAPRTGLGRGVFTGAVTRLPRWPGALSIIQAAPRTGRGPRSAGNQLPAAACATVRPN